MDAPLGNAVGNALEVAEAIETLQGKGPTDLLELVVTLGRKTGKDLHFNSYPLPHPLIPIDTLGGKLLELTGRAPSLEEGKKRLLEAIESGEALRRFAAMLLCQGVSPDCATELCEGDVWKWLPKAPVQTTIRAESTGMCFVN